MNFSVYLVCCRYLTQKLLQKKISGLEDDMEVESVADSEFEQFLDEYEKGQADVDMDFAAYVIWIFSVN